MPLSNCNIGVYIGKLDELSWLDYYRLVQQIPLTDYEIVQLQEQVTRTEQELNILDPANPIEAQMIEHRVTWLESLVSDLTDYPVQRATRHLRLIVS
jgi:hypothetical protein